MNNKLALGINRLYRIMNEYDFDGNFRKAIKSVFDFILVEMV